jgi:riboflavin biosynthesis pyrimidine reductase
MRTSRFERYERHKTEAALAARLPGVASVFGPRELPSGMVALGNAWSMPLFDGPFYRSESNDARQMPAVSLVFVESADGNTGADDPSTLGGGETDKHLVYEGLSRVDADAVLAGAVTAADDDIAFSVWHPALVRLRQERGRSRHPVQVIVTRGGELPIERALIYNEETLRVIVLATTFAAEKLARRVAARPWVEVIDCGAQVDLQQALRLLYKRGIVVISAIGGRTTAESLLRAGVVQDLYLTTSGGTGGEPNTPLSRTPLPPHRVLLEKAGRGDERGVRFRHLILS